MLVFGTGWDDDAGSFLVEAGVERKEVRVAPEDWGVGRVLKDIVVVVVVMVVRVGDCVGLFRGMGVYLVGCVWHQMKMATHRNEKRDILMALELAWMTDCATKTLK